MPFSYASRVRLGVSDHLLHPAFSHRSPMCPESVSPGGACCFAFTLTHGGPPPALALTHASSVYGSVHHMRTFRWCAERLRPDHVRVPPHQYADDLPRRPALATCSFHPAQRNLRWPSTPARLSPSSPCCRQTASTHCCPSSAPRYLCPVIRAQARCSPSALMCARRQRGIALGRWRRL